MTLGQAIDQILSDLGRSDNSITAFASQEIQNAIVHYETTRFAFNEAKASFTVSSTIYYPLANLSTIFTEIDQVSAIVNSNSYELVPTTHAELQRMDSGNYSGQPARWGLWAESIRIYPKAGAATTYQAEVFGTKKLATLSATGDSNAWLVQGSQMIIARAEKNLCANRYKDTNAAAIYAQVEQDAFNRLISQAEKLESSGRLTPGY